MMIDLFQQKHLMWKVQLVGDWSEEFGNIIDCQVQQNSLDFKDEVCVQILENGEIVVKLPSLPAGEYQYKFLINGVPLVDEKMNFKNDIFNHCNILKVEEDGEMIMQKYNRIVQNRLGIIYLH